jgi:hypothetical protein
MAGRNAVLSEKVGSEQRNLAGQHIVDGGLNYFFNVTRCFRRAEGCLLHGHWRIENFCAFPPIPEVMWKFADVKWPERLTLADVSPLVTVSTPLLDDVDV